MKYLVPLGYTLIKINNNVCFFKRISFQAYIYRFDSRSPNSRIDFDTIDKPCEYLEVEVGDIFEYVKENKEKNNKK
jgi:hypothetical protein